MNKTGKYLIPVMLLCILITSIPTAITLANSAEPPSLLILTKNPPEALSIVLVSGENKPEAAARKVAWEGYYIFYKRDLQMGDKYIFKVSVNGESFEVTLSTPIKGYNNVYTLDLSDRELKPGVYPFRSALLVSIRLLLTLLLESIVFWCFRFRQKRSWLAFLLINLATQAVLNIWLNSGATPLQSYLIFSLVFGEIFVFGAEMIVFPALIKEHKKGYILAYVFIANLVSLFAGGCLISVLPV